MSESTYFKMTTKTIHSKPIAELEYLLYHEWDTWNVMQTREEDIEAEDFYTECDFQVIIYELNKDESKGIIEKIKAKAQELEIDLNIELMNEYHG